METKIPGLKSGHQIITAECRATRGTTGAFDEAVQRIRRQYDDYAKAEANEGVHWHLVLVREEPGSSRPPQQNSEDGLND